MSDKHQEHFEQIACAVCGKGPGLSADECFGSQGQRNPLCREYGKCRIREKTDEQFAYVTTLGNRNVFLRACPGAGKTEVVGLKAAYEMRGWDRCPGGIAVLTFTNNAADVIKERVLQFAGAGKVGHPHFVGTIDSWLYGYIANPFGHRVTGYEGRHGDHSIRVIDRQSTSPFLHSFATKYNSYGQTGYVQANQYYVRAASNEVVFASANLRVDNKRRAGVLEAWQKKDLLNTKDRFWRAGFATYEDIERIASSLLSEHADVVSAMARRFPLVIVDECQDLSEGQLSILGALIDAGSNVHLIGDVDQAIYLFKEADPECVNEFAEARGFEELLLRQNFRSDQRIVDLCCRLVGRDTVVGQRYNEEGPACVCVTYKAGNEHKLAGAFGRCLRNRRLRVERSAVLARGDSALSRLRPALPSKDVPKAKRLALAIHLWKSNSADTKNEALECAGSFMAEELLKGPHRDRRYHYCPQSQESSLRWRISLSRILAECVKDPSLADMQVTWSVWVSQINKILPRIVSECCPGLDVPGFEERRLAAPRGEKDSPVLESLGTTQGKGTRGIRVTTIHKAKGETLDAVLLVSSAGRGEGAHWTEWLDTASGSGEHTRFAYVASSRPKHLLVWAIPASSKDDLEKIRDLGFALVGSTPDEEQIPAAQQELEF